MLRDSIALDVVPICNLMYPVAHSTTSQLNNPSSVPLYLLSQKLGAQIHSLVFSSGRLFDKVMLHRRDLSHSNQRL